MTTAAGDERDDGLERRDCLCAAGPTFRVWPSAARRCTAEVGNGKQPHSWFIGYAPADRPGVAVAVIMENKGSGTTYATRRQKVLQAALKLGY